MTVSVTVSAWHSVWPDAPTGWTTGVHMPHPLDDALCNVPLTGGFAGFIITFLLCSINSGAARRDDCPVDRERSNDHHPGMEPCPCNAKPRCDLYANAHTPTVSLPTRQDHAPLRD